MSSSRYETLARIGTGGMATVFVARARGALGFERLVALKRAHPHVRDDAELRQSLRLEARLAGRLRHPNVVAVVDVQEADGEIELVLDYVEGVTLAELLRACENEANSAAMVRIVLDVAAGLAAAHAAIGDDGAPLGVVHRDVTPSNVLVGTDGMARISDFGIAHATLRDGDHTATGVLKGKVGYMAPEYVERYRADAKSDQFSLAVVAWEALSGKKLFKGPTEIETLKRVVATKVPPLALDRPSLAALEPVIVRALARRPEDRFETVAALGDALEKAAREADLVATHAEVAALVRRLARETLDERARRIADASGSAKRDLRELEGQVPSARDLVATASVVVPRDSVPVPRDTKLDDDESARTVSRTVDVAPPRAARSSAIAFGAFGALVVVAAVAVAVAAFRTTGAAADGSVASPSSSSPSPSPSPSSAPSATASAAPAPAEVETIELVDEAPSADAGRRGTKGPKHPPSLVPTKAPPNPYLKK